MRTMNVFSESNWLIHILKNARCFKSYITLGEYNYAQHLSLVLEKRSSAISNVLLSKILIWSISKISCKWFVYISVHFVSGELSNELLLHVSVLFYYLFLFYFGTVIFVIWIISILEQLPVLQFNLDQFTIP